MSIVILANGACAGRQHVRLEPAPSADSPAPERLAAYERLRVAGAGNPSGYKRTATDPDEVLILADGRLIYYPSDLLPVVPEKSRAAEAAYRARDADETKSLMGWIFTGGIAAGLGTSVTGAVLETVHGSPGGELAVYGLLGTLAIMTAALVTMGIPFWKFKNEKLSAFVTYEQSLRQRLGLCMEKQEAVPCEMRAVEPGLARP